MASTLLCPKQFDGSSRQDVNDFLHTFACYADFANWENRKKLKALKGMLVGNAGRWLQRQNLEGVTYDQLVELLKDKYKISPAHQFQLKTELSAISQGSDETVDHFVERIQHLCDRLNLEADTQVHHFVNGLKPMLKAHVLRNQPLTLEAAASAARAEEAARALTAIPQQPRSHVDQVQVSSVMDVIKQLNAVSAKVTCQLCHQEGHTAPSCTSPSKSMSMMCQLCSSPQHMAPQCPSRYQTAPRPRRPRHEIQCYNCHEFGHYRRECQQVPQWHNQATSQAPPPPQQPGQWHNQACVQGPPPPPQPSQGYNSGNGQGPPRQR